MLVGILKETFQGSCNLRETNWPWSNNVLRDSKIRTLTQEVYGGMVRRFIYHVEVKSKHSLGIKTKDKAIVGSGGWVRLALTRDIEVVWENHSANKSRE